MKKIIVLITLFCVMCCSMLTVNANDEMNENDNKIKEEKVINYQYVITPKSSEWEKYTRNELIQLLDIEKNIAKKMDTNELIDVVLDYPYIGDIFAFDDTITGINVLAEDFYALEELLSRKDFKQCLVNEFTDVSKYALQADALDNDERMSLMVNEAFIIKLSKEEKFSKAEVNNLLTLSSSVCDIHNTTPLVLEGKSEANSVYNIKTSGELYVYTPYILGISQSIAVEVVQYAELTNETIELYDDYVKERYPNVTLLRSATSAYNCHSYAWYSTSTSNSYWMPDPSAYMICGAYESKTSPKAYDKIYYPINNYEHSGIISSIQNDVVYVKSKWGALGLVLHKWYDCPYSAGGAANVSYWRMRLLY